MENLEQDKLATSVASFFPPPTETISQEYQRLNDLALGGAKKVANRCESLNAAWTELMPTLNAMQRLLSERGVDRGVQPATGLPTWTQWLKRYLKETNLGVSMRTVQRHLNNLRGLGRRKTEPSDRPLKLSLNEQRRLLTLSQCTYELISALKWGTEYRPALEECDRLIMGPEQIEQLLDSIPREAVPTTRPPVLLPAQAAGNTIGTASSGTSVALLQPRVALPKVGNGSGLADFVIATGGDGFATALSGLEPGVMATTLQECARKIVGRFCTFDRGLGQITVNIQYLQENALTNRHAA